jgi:hypothetical protein
VRGGGELHQVADSLLLELPRSPWIDTYRLQSSTTRGTTTNCRRLHQTASIAKRFGLPSHRAHLINAIRARHQSNSGNSRCDAIHTKRRTNNSKVYSTAIVIMTVYTRVPKLPLYQLSWLFLKINKPKFRSVSFRSSSTYHIYELYEKFQSM